MKVNFKAICSKHKITPVEEQQLMSALEIIGHTVLLLGRVVPKDRKEQVLAVFRETITQGLKD